MDALHAVIVVYTVFHTVKYGFSTTNGVVVRSGSRYYFNVYISEEVTEALSLVARVTWKKSQCELIADTIQ